MSVTRTRGEAATAAAEGIYAAVLASLKDTTPEAYEGSREFRAKLDIEARIGDAMGRSYDEALGLMLSEGIREAEYESISGVSMSDFAEEGDDPEKFLSGLEKLKRACQQTIEKIDEQLEHVCSYDEEDAYCIVCGGDGRA